MQVWQYLECTKKKKKKKKGKTPVTCFLFLLVLAIEPDLQMAKQQSKTLVAFPPLPLRKTPKTKQESQEGLCWTSLIIPVFEMTIRTRVWRVFCWNNCTPTTRETDPKLKLKFPLSSSWKRKNCLKKKTQLNIKNCVKLKEVWKCDIVEEKHRHDQHQRNRGCPKWHHLVSFSPCFTHCASVSREMLMNLFFKPWLPVRISALCLI